MEWQRDVLVGRNEARTGGVRAQHIQRELRVEAEDHQVVAHLVLIVEHDLDLLAALGMDLARLKPPHLALARELPAGLDRDAAVAARRTRT